MAKGPHEFTPQPRPQAQPPPGLELLAGSRDGMTGAMLLAHGFMVDMLVELIRAGLAAARTQRLPRN
jgi:hypothetical protein